MPHKKLIKETALQTIDIEKNAIENISQYINEDFVLAVENIFETKGRVIISGIGKSAIVAQKIVATLNSTGTPAIFLHAADAIHGDLGMMTQDDIVIVISKSGESAEIKLLIALIKNFGNTLIAICGSEQSYLAQHANYFINSTVSKEACPNNLAPTASTTVQMVMGDAIAVSLLKMKGFSTQDFAKYHPGGALGKQMYLTVDTLCKANLKPLVHENDSISKVIVEMTQKRLGATVVLNKNNEIAGIITDGDIRRMLEKNESFSTLVAKDIMNIIPKMIDRKELAIHALQMMRINQISQLLVSNNGKYEGIVHIHDIIKEGII